MYFQTNKENTQPCTIEFDGPKLDGLLSTRIGGYLERTFPTSMCCLALNGWMNYLDVWMWITG